MSWRRIGTVVLLLAWVGGGCTLLGLGQKREKTAADRARERDARGARDPDEWDAAGGDDEAGVRNINRNLRMFRAALKEKDFDYATKWLSKAVKQTREASELTKGHPDFEDIEMLVERSRRRLDVAIETDRIERRNAAIDDLIFRGDKAMGQANAIYLDLSRRVPDEDDVSNLEDLIELFLGLKSEGSIYLAEDRYAEHALDRDEKVSAVVKLRDESRWLTDAMNEVGGKITTAYRAAVKGHKTPDIKKRVRLFSSAGIGFKSCATAISDLEGKSRYDPAKMLKTRLGEMTIVDTKRKCLELSRQARQQVAAMTWRQGVDDVVQSVNVALARLRTPKDATAELEYAREATDVLKKCHGDLNKNNKKDGFDGKRKFDTLLGQLNAMQLGKACSREKNKVTKKLPQIEWRSKLATVQARLDEVARLSEDAAASTSGADKAAMLEQAIGGLKECQAEAKGMSRKRGADRSLQIRTAFGKLTISAIERLCNEQRRIIDKRLVAAIKQRNAEGFAQDAKGAEKDVIRREGVPSRIEAFAGGRIFIYEKFNKRGIKERKRFGFDQAGRRVDYWVEWRNQVVGVVSELSRVLGLVEEADSATAMFKAVETAMPVLDICQEAIAASKKSPGYDSKAVFTTPLGKLTTDRLVQACVKERAKMVSDMTTIRWHSRAEELRNRVNKVADLLNKADGVRDPDARIEAISLATGGLQECVERAAQLPAEKGADAEYKLDTVYGELTIAQVQSACETMLEDAKDSTDKALRDKEVQKFVTKCRGDEVEVAWREGIPDKVITFGSNRIFVYNLPEGGKAKTKRYAFDAEGKRINEATILADLSIEPEIVEIDEDGDLPLPDLELPAP